MGENICGIMNSMCKCPELGVFLEYLQADRRPKELEGREWELGSVEETKLEGELWSPWRSFQIHLGLLGNNSMIWIEKVTYCGFHDKIKIILPTGWRMNYRKVKSGIITGTNKEYWSLLHLYNISPKVFYTFNWMSTIILR